MHEAFNFYQFVKTSLGHELRLDPEAKMLDFGSGWGRMIRPFMRHFDLNNIYGFEPDPVFRTIARTLNPYVCFLGGEYLPARRIPRDAFDLIIGYSVFSHLSERAAALWLREFAEVLRPGGFGVFTTWGERFLNYLKEEHSRAKQGEEIHWYHKFVISKAGDIDDLLERYLAGRFVWVDADISPLYGDAFLGAAPLTAIIAENALPLDVVCFDRSTLPQDAFIIRRR